MKPKYMFFWNSLAFCMIQLNVGNLSWFPKTRGAHRTQGNILLGLLQKMEETEVKIRG